MVTMKAPGTRPITDIAPDLLEKWFTEGNTVLIDVREDFEHAEERIDGAESMPLSKLDPDALRARHANARVVFHCRTGRRSVEAARRYFAQDEPAFHLAGGLEAWKAAGRSTVRSATGPRLPVMRQVQLTAGFLVAIGTALGVFASPWFLILPAFVGCGLMFAGASGWCGMAMLLARMPWNRRIASASCGTNL